jgi:hexosaminidase
MQQKKGMSLLKKNAVITAVCTMAFLTGAFAQQVSTFNPNQLAITIAAVTNNYNNKNQALSVFTIKNNSKKILPATGWKLYFNSKNNAVLKEGTTEFMLEQFNGNLFKLSPAGAFKGVMPGGTITAALVFDGQMLNKNDQPEGFYFVWDNAREKGTDVKNLTTTAVPMQPVDGKIISDFATAAYNRNEALEKITAEKLPKVFPAPVSYQENGSFFLLNSTVQINAGTAFKKEAHLLADDVLQLNGQRPVITTAVATGAAIALIRKEGIAPEGYELTVKAEGVTIAASSPQGIFYGIQSFKSLLPPASWSITENKKTIAVPGVTITDAPRFGYRGFMLDAARNFQTKKEVLKLLDLMALYKLNTFHFHLTDDEGWRIEIDGLPELTDIGSKRGHTTNEKNNLSAAYGSGAVTDSLYGSGYYSKADFIEILKYATARHIKVIPEIETPGHARAAIKAMDTRYERLMKEGKKEAAAQYFLRDINDRSVYTTAQNYHDNVINVALPSVYTFVEKVVNEVVKLYQQAEAPLTSIHLGGDEVPAGVWEQSPDCIALINDNPEIKNTDGLWYYYIGKVNNILKANGLTLSGWEEIAFRKTMADGKKITIPNPEFVNQDMKLYVWNNTTGSEDLAYKQANAGYKVILTFVSNFYFDMAQYKTYDEPGYYWGGYTGLEKTYRFIPYDYFKNVKEDNNGNLLDQSFYAGKQRLSDYGKQNITGLQGAVWSETLKGPQQMEYMVLPRLIALAERAWAKDPEWATETDTAKSNDLYNKAWSGFVNILGTRELPRLDYFAGGFNYRIPFAGAVIKEGKVFANVQFPELIIRYTTNGDVPAINSRIYSTPVTEKGIIKFKVFNKKGRSGNITVIENK